MDKYCPPPVKHSPPVAKRRCHRCNGTGRQACVICNGQGQIPQGKDIHFKTQYGMCHGCYGHKSRRCTVCSGEGFIT